MSHSSFPCFYDCVSYALHKLQMTNITFQGEQCYTMETISELCIINLKLTTCIWRPGYKATLDHALDIPVNVTVIIACWLSYCTCCILVIGASTLCSCQDSISHSQNQSRSMVVNHLWSVFVSSMLVVYVCSSVCLVSYHLLRLFCIGLSSPIMTLSVSNLTPK